MKQIVKVILSQTGIGSIISTLSLVINLSNLPTIIIIIIILELLESLAGILLSRIYNFLAGKSNQ